MVLMNGSSRARNAASLVNQTNTGGGIKKAGLPSSVCINASIGAIYRKRIGCPCPEDRLIISTTRTNGGIGSTIPYGSYY